VDGIATIGASHRPLRDKVVDELRRRIIDGLYGPGHRLTEERLAEDFGVSRNPVREAIRVLEAEGFLVAQPRRGAVVASLSAQDVEELFDVRLSLEVLAARLAAARTGAARAGAARAGAARRGVPAVDGGDAVDVDVLDKLLAEARAAPSAAELSALNTRFHAAICGLSGNALLAGIMESLHGRLQWVYRQSAEVRAPHSWAEHTRLAEAIRAGDAPAAERAARAHVLAARRSALAVVAATL